jgi:hypothetical protein
MTVNYGYEWNDLMGSIRDPYDEDTARSRHESGELYTAVLGDPAAPDAIVKVHLKIPYVGVHFYDDHRRRYMKYAFGDPEGGRMFLEETWRATFGDDGTQTAAETYYFDKTGLVTARETDLTTRMADTYNVHADVSANWEPVPTFGHYDSIARIERDQPLPSRETTGRPDSPGGS